MRIGLVRLLCMCKVVVNTIWSKSTERLKPWPRTIGQTKLNSPVPLPKMLLTSESSDQTKQLTTKKKTMVQTPNIRLITHILQNSIFMSSFSVEALLNWLISRTTLLTQQNEKLQKLPQTWLNWTQVKARFSPSYILASIWLEEISFNLQT